MKQTILLLILVILLAACTQSTQSEPLCKSPYIEYKVGDCCLDANDNNICDTDEKQPEPKSEPVAEVVKKPELIPEPVVEEPEETKLSEKEIFTECKRGGTNMHNAHEFNEWSCIWSYAVEYDDPNLCKETGIFLAECFDELKQVGLIDEEFCDTLKGYDIDICYGLIYAVDGVRDGCDSHGGIDYSSSVIKDYGDRDLARMKGFCEIGYVYWSRDYLRCEIFEYGSKGLPYLEEMCKEMKYAFN